MRKYFHASYSMPHFYRLQLFRKMYRFLTIWNNDQQNIWIHFEFISWTDGFKLLTSIYERHKCKGILASKESFWWYACIDNVMSASKLDVGIIFMEWKTVSIKFSQVNRFEKYEFIWHEVRMENHIMKQELK